MEKIKWLPNNELIMNQIIKNQIIIIIIIINKRS